MELELQKGSRSKLLAAFMFAVIFLFAARLFYLQIIQHNYYVGVAKSEQVKRLNIPAKRGLIFALNGELPVPLVMNQTIYTVFADPQTVEDDEKIIDVIKKVAGGNARADLQTLLDKKASRYQILATKITRVQADKIKSENLRGIGFQESTQRVYPEASLASHVLGFVNDAGEGQYGIEGGLNDRLIGQDGMLQSVTDVRDIPLTIGDNNINKPAIDGENIVLSIDTNIQSKVEQSLVEAAERIGATEVSAIVMDPQSGKVLAMANLPKYNPAEFNKVQDINVYNNNVISLPYEPASVMKTFTMATGIDKGAISPSATYVNKDFIVVEDKIINNSSKGLGTVLSFQQVLNWSLNTGTVTVFQRLGDGENITRGSREIVYDYFYNRFRLGQKTGIELANESSGIIISPDEVEGNAVRYSNMSFGQGLDVTMLQTASAFCSIVNGGNYYKPTVVAGTLNKEGVFSKNETVALSQPISKSTADQVRTMTHVTRTYNSSKIDKPGYYLGGKTGTAEVLVDGSYSNDGGAIGTYLGYGGSEELSRYVIMVKVANLGKVFRGAQEAGPIFTDISNWMIDYLKLQPKG
ncbi:MAG: penicillin-binding protein 2 [Candidatus Saccharibacteria bacterium]